MLKQKKDSLRKIYSIGLLILAPILDFYLMEGFYMNAHQETREYAQILNCVLYLLIGFLLFCLIGKSRIALVIESVFFCFVGLLNAYIIEFRSSPIVPWDLYSIRTATSVAGSYDFSLDASQIKVLIAFGILIVAELFTNLTFSWKKWRSHLAGIATTGGMLIAITCMLHTDTWVSNWNLYPFLFTPTVMGKRDGFLVTFLLDLQYLAVDKPEGYLEEKALALLEDYATDGEEVDTEELPNIIVIMDEAFSDLAVLGDLETNVDYMPFIHSLQEDAENTITGTLNVSVKGGNTANTEFEFLTGNTMAFLPTGSIPYQQYIKSETSGLTSYLNSLGYTSLAVHPYNATGWSRNVVYPLLGFEEFYDITDFTGQTYVRDYVSDESDFEKIIELYEENDSDDPLFLFNVTMQNHGGYTEGAANLTEDVEATNLSSEYVNRYLSLIQLTDEALEQLIAYFEEVDDPTIIVFFGDHQPNDTIAAPILAANGKDYQNLSEEDTDARYTVPYVIWANYDIEEASDVETSVNYLAAQVLTAAGVPTDAYQNFLLELQESYPVISAEKIMDAEGNTLSIDDVDLTDYEILQYYFLFDEGDEDE